jgi:FkbM family methyltransferase
MNGFSQYGQDTFVDEFLGGRRGGFFLDIGAHDGVTFSNSLFFEKHRGWRGVCIEPNPSVYEKLSTNRTCKSLNVAVSERSGMLKFAKVSGHAEMLSGIVDDYDPKHLKRIKREVTQHGGDVELIEVAAVSVNKLLESMGVTTVDFCSIDTEGGELPILQGIDFKRFHFRTIAVENNYRSVEFRKLLTAAGFKLLHTVSCDEIYANVRDIQNHADPDIIPFTPRAKRFFGFRKKAA